MEIINCESCNISINTKNVNGKIQRECLLTQLGIELIPNCPCLNCLLIINCNSMCKEFIDNVKKNSTLISLREYVFKINNRKVQF